MKLRLLALAASFALMSGPVLAQDANPPSSDSAPVSTAQSTDQKIAAWLDQKDASSGPKTTKPRPDDFLRDPGEGQSDGKIHGEVGVGVGSGGYRSAYGVANIPISKDVSATVALSYGQGRYPWVAGAPWAVGAAGPGIRADCVCTEAPDGSQVCHVGRAASRVDADMAQAACNTTTPP